MMLAFVMVFMFCNVGYAASYVAHLYPATTIPNATGILLADYKFHGSGSNVYSETTDYLVFTLQEKQTNQSTWDTTISRAVSPGNIYTSPRYVVHGVVSDPEMHVRVKIAPRTSEGGVRARGTIYDF